MKLSLCLITFNEEKNIHYPLDSAYDLADEVVLVDGGSTDKTIEIAKSYGDKVRIIKTNNPKNFLINKQKAIEEAKGEWILQLDADEELSSELKQEIKKLFKPVSLESRVQNSESSVDPKTNSEFSILNFKFCGYNIPRKNWFLTRFLMKGGVYPDYVLRLYKKEGANFDLKDVHENVKIKGEVGYLKSPILHYADPNFGRYLARWNRYTTFEAEKLAKEGKKLNFFVYFFIKPHWWFLKTYFRHKGFMDGFPGFVFSLFSSIRFWSIYVKWWNFKNKNGTRKSNSN